MQPTSRRPISSRKSNGPEAQNLTSTNASHTIKSIMRCLVLDRKDDYFNHAVPEEKFTEEFQRLLAGVMSAAPELNMSFAGWFNMNQSFYFYGLDLESLFEKSINGEELSEQELSDRLDRQTFVSRFHDTVVKRAR